MWEKIKTILQHPAARMLKKYCGDPVQLYSVFLTMTAMYYYHEDFWWVYTLIAVPISYLLMRFYDFVAGKRFIGPVCYLVFLGVGLYLTNMLVTAGARNYPISFFVWFLTPQGVVDFSLVYTIAIYLLMAGFLTSTVYYFAKVRYRMVMQLIIMLIPLSLYAKEGRHMPALLVILLLSCFFLMMVYCRQLRENKDILHMEGSQSGVSVALYVAVFTVVAAIIPKPQFQADREFIDNAMSYSSWSDVLMNAISMFTNTTSSTATNSNNARTLYYAASPEPLRLRTQTFTYYQADDSWNTVDAYDLQNRTYQSPMTYQPRALTQAILDAAAADADFAKQYHLEDLGGLHLPDQQPLELELFPTWYIVTAIPSPSRSNELAAQNISTIMLSANDVFSPGMKEDGAQIRYYSDTYVRYESELTVLRRLNHDSYRQLLSDAQRILRDSDPQAAELLGNVTEELYAADVLLKTADRMDYRSETVDRLAAEITEGLDSDIEKALAIERYFTDQRFVYDLSYQKQAGENVDDFLSTTHIGVCYEYATAMTLLCRSAGLPARYVQGFNMSEEYTARGRRRNGSPIETNYAIKMRNAHGFPEVYISGYGWVSFEPTVSSNDIADDTAENQNVMRLGYVLLALLLVVLGVWAALPYLRERHFRRKLPAMSPDAAASAVFRRMRTTLHLSDSVTVDELKHSSADFFREEALFTAVDALLYNPTKHPYMTSSQLAETYIRWQADRKAYVKEQKKLRKEQKKTNVNI